MTIIHQFPHNLIEAETCKFFIGRRHINASNPWTRHVQVQGPIDERWIVDITFPALSLEELSDHEAFIDLNDGMAGFFTFHDPVIPFPRGAAAGGNDLNGGITVTKFDDGTTFDDGTAFADGAGHGSVVAAASAGDEFLKIGGLKASEAVSLKPNDKFAIRKPGQAYGYLHKVLTTVASDANGETLVKIRPRLRRPVPIGHAVQFNFASGVFRMEDDDGAALQRRRPAIGAVGFRLIEAHEVIEL